MSLSNFEILEQKIEKTLAHLAELNRSKKTLEDELAKSNSLISQLEETNMSLRAKIEETELQLSNKDSDMSQTKDRIQNLINKLESENLDEVLQF